MKIPANPGDIFPDPIDTRFLRLPVPFGYDVWAG